MASNIISTGLNTGSTIFNSNGGILISGDAVKGGYFVTDTIANIPTWANTEGALCFCTGITGAEDYANKFYQYNGTDWVVKEFGTKVEGSTNGKIKIDGTDTTVYTHAIHTEQNTSGLYKITVDSEGHVDSTTAVTKSDITALGIPGQDTTYEHPDHTPYTNGLYKITVDNEGHVSAATAVQKSDITGLGIPAQDTIYEHPDYTAHNSGLYKITVDSLGHVSAATAVEKSDITSLGIPAQDTTYTSKTAVSGGTAVSLVTTGEKYTWNNKQDKIDSNNKLAASLVSGLADVATSGAYSDLSGTPGVATKDGAGLMSATDKVNLDTLTDLLQQDDEVNTTIDTIKEVLKAFENAPEGTDIANALAGKSDTEHTHTVSHTPAGTVSQPTFTGEPKDTESSYSGVNVKTTSFTGAPDQETESAEFSGDHKDTSDITVDSDVSVKTVNTEPAKTDIKVSSYFIDVIDNSVTSVTSEDNSAISIEFAGTEATLQSDKPNSITAQAQFINPSTKQVIDLWNTNKKGPDGSAKAAATTDQSYNAYVEAYLITNKETPPSIQENNSASIQSTIDKRNMAITFTPEALTLNMDSLKPINVATDIHTHDVIVEEHSHDITLPNISVDIEDNHTHTYTPEGKITGKTQHTHDITLPSIQSDVTDNGHYHKFTHAVDKITNTVKIKDHKHKYTASGTIDVELEDKKHSHSYTPAGTVSQPTFTGEPCTTVAETQSGSVTSTFTGTSCTIETSTTNVTTSSPQKREN